MAREEDIPPAPTAMAALLADIAPGSTLEEIAPLPGSYSNYTHLVRAATATGEPLQLVVRRYRSWGDSAPDYTRPAARARREYAAFALLRRHGIPAPPPLRLDDTGALLGSPGIVTGYVQGTQVEDPGDPVHWAQELATMLACLHAAPCDAEARRLFLDMDSYLVWFLRGGGVPDFMAADPDGAAVWHSVRDHLPTRRPVSHGFVHADYWPGNILWVGDSISAVLDLEEAGIGDPSSDVAYCRMCMLLSGEDTAAATFLACYEAATGGPCPNLAFWDLAAAARPMIDPADWQLDRPATHARFRAFIADALRRI